LRGVLVEEYKELPANDRIGNGPYAVLGTQYAEPWSLPLALPSRVLCTAYWVLRTGLGGTSPPHESSQRTPHTFQVSERETVTPDQRAVSSHGSTTGSTGKLAPWPLVCTSCSLPKYFFVKRGVWPAA